MSGDDNDILYFKYEHKRFGKCLLSFMQISNIDFNTIYTRRFEHQAIGFCYDVEDSNTPPVVYIKDKMQQKSF